MHTVLQQSKLTVLSKTLYGNENTEFGFDVYNVVSFSAPNNMASSNKMAETRINQNMRK